MKKIVLTGAPHSGKTTMVNAMLELGHLIIPETALTVINALSDLLGPEGALKWRRNHFNGFQELISERQSYMEASYESIDDFPALQDLMLDISTKAHGQTNPEDRLLVLDRGAHDGIAFARHYQKAFPEKATKYIKDVRYNQVFILDLILPFDDRSESGRVDSEEDCIALQQHITDVYTEIGLEPILVPVMPIDERLKFILDKID